MNVYHITYSDEVREAYIHFWGCNINCRICLLRERVYDCHIDEKGGGRPKNFLSFRDVISILEPLRIERVIFMGAEPSIDPLLPELARALKDGHGSRNILLTNGFYIPPLDHIDEVVFSIKAVSEDIHRRLTGFPNKIALSNFRKVYEMVPSVRAESVLIPDLVYFEEIEKIASFIAGVDERIPYRIDAYFPIPGCPWRKPEGWEMEEAVSRAKRHLKNVSCLKGDEELKFRVRRIY